MGGEGHGSQSCLWNDTPLACHNHHDPHHQRYMMIHDDPYQHHTILTMIIILESHSVDLAWHKVFSQSWQWHLEE